MASMKSIATTVSSGEKTSQAVLALCTSLPFSLQQGWQCQCCDYGCPRQVHRNFIRCWVCAATTLRYLAPDASQCCLTSSRKLFAWLRSPCSA